MDHTLRNLVHTLYHYEVIAALSESSEVLVDVAKANHSARLRRISLLGPRAEVEFSKKLQVELLTRVEKIPDVTAVEKEAVREYIEYLEDTPLRCI